MVQYSAAGVSVRLAASSSDVVDIDRQIMGPRYFEVMKDQDEVVSATYACAAPVDVDTTCADDGEGRIETTAHVPCNDRSREGGRPRCCVRQLKW
jgi:hypothetical protein